MYIWLRKTDGYRLDVLFWLRNIGCLIVKLSRIKTDIPDIISCDIWIRTCMLENKCQGFSSIDQNGEASYLLLSINK